MADEQQISTEQMAADSAAIMLPREVTARIYERAAELAKIEARMHQLEGELENLRDDRRTLTQKTLPDLFDHLHTDHLGVPGWNADVVLNKKTHAAIKQDWDEDKTTAAYRELDRLRGMDLVKHTVSVQFDKNEAELAAEFVRMIRGWNRLGGREVLIRREVHWATLTAFVKRELDKPGAKIDLQALGASVTRECEIKWRKA